ncbi:MAG: DUF1801 domain-containing protein [Chloroflexi bacterium]|nr:DUF1801 domain-containing protein [Chloroflexota bacterium]
MAELKTQKTDASVEAFLNSVADEQQRRDSFAVLDLMKKVSRAEPKMWGPAIVGFGQYRYKYDSGRENDWFPIGFSPRKGNLTLYLAGGLEPQADLLAQLGKHKTGKGCIYIKKLTDVDQTVLKQMLERCLKNLP